MVDIVIFRYAIAIYEHKNFYLRSNCRLQNNEISSLNDLKLSLHKVNYVNHGVIVMDQFTLMLHMVIHVDAVNDNNLEQLINGTTHGNHILDLLFCSLSQMFKSHLEPWTMMLSSFN